MLFRSPRPEVPAVSLPEQAPFVEAPEAAKGIRFVLREVLIQGITVFPQKEWQALAAPYLGKEVTLNVAWPCFFSLQTLA